jgi:hypothetical protein
MNVECEILVINSSLRPIEWQSATVNDLLKDGFLIRFEDREPPMMASIEWATIEAIVLIVGTQYFTNFLKIKETAEDHRTKLDSFIRNVIAESKQSLAAKHKSRRPSNYNQSHAFSTTFETITGIKVKLLFDNDLDGATWHSCIMNFWRLLELHFANFPTDEITEEIKKLDFGMRKPMTIYGVIDKSTLGWILLTDMEMIAKDRNGWT